MSSEALVLEQGSRTLNPYGNAPPASTATADVERMRAVTETLASLEIAQRFPRDERKAMDRILTACTRPSLAEKALYAYARGGTNISGPSIRLAETLAQCWGNLDFGFREIERRKGESSVESFAWDKETNTTARRAVQVAHVRDTRQGAKILTDGRDIYELIANDAARRTRAAILALIPADVVDAAVQQVNKTLTTSIKITPELTENLVTKFGAIGVPLEALEKNIQRRIDTITPALVIRLRTIYNSINDGMSKPTDWFEIDPEPDGSRVVTLREKLKKEADDGKPASAATQAEGDGPPAAGSETDAGDEASRVAKMSGPELTVYVKGLATELGLSDEERDDVVNACGGWQKKNAVKILAGLRELAASIEAQASGQT